MTTRLKQPSQQRTVSDERELSYAIGVCDNCGKTRKVRRIEQKDAFTGESRGWTSVSCYYCIAPMVKWITPDGRPMISSVHDKTKWGALADEAA